MGMTIGQLVRSLARETGGKIDEVNEKDQYYVLTVPFTDGRSQQLAVYLGQDDDGAEWFVASSRFGELSELDASALLQRNDSGYGFTYVSAREDGSVDVVAQFPLEITSVELAKRAIVEVAAWADSLEEEFYGDDQG
jgi:hypothetical protein